MPKITLSRTEPPRLLLGWERRVYPDDVVLHRRYADPRILKAWDTLSHYPRVLSDFWGPIDYWRSRKLAKALLRHPELLSLLPEHPRDGAAFALAVAQRFGYMRNLMPYKTGACFTCGWPTKSAAHQKRCPAETKARRRYRRLEALPLDRFAHPQLPGVLRASLTEVLAGKWRPGRSLGALEHTFYFARYGLSEYYCELVDIVGPYQAPRFWRAYHLKRHLRIHLQAPRADHRAVLRALVPEAFRRLPVCTKSVP